MSDRQRPCLMQAAALPALVGSPRSRVAQKRHWSRTSSFTIQAVSTPSRRAGQRECKTADRRPRIHDTAWFFHTTLLTPLRIYAVSHSGGRRSPSRGSGDSHMSLPSPRQSEASPRAVGSPKSAGRGGQGARIDPVPAFCLQPNRLFFDDAAAAAAPADVAGSLAERYSLRTLYTSRCSSLGLRRPPGHVLQQLPGEPGRGAAAELHTLVLRNTYTSSKACHALTVLLPYCTELEYIDLSHAGLQSKAGCMSGINALLDALGCGTAGNVTGAALHTLDVSGNTLSDRTGVRLARLIERLPHLRVVNVEGTAMSNTVKYRIAAALRRGTSWAAPPVLVDDNSEAEESVASPAAPPFCALHPLAQLGVTSGLLNAEAHRATASSSAGRRVGRDGATDSDSDDDETQHFIPDDVAAALVELRKRLHRNWAHMQRVYDCFVLPESEERGVSLSNTAYASFEEPRRACSSAGPRGRARQPSQIHLELLGAASVQPAQVMETQSGLCSWKAFFRALRVLGIHSASRDLKQAIHFAGCCGILTTESVQFGKLLNLLRSHVHVTAAGKAVATAAAAAGSTVLVEQTPLPHLSQASSFRVGKPFTRPENRAAAAAAAAVAAPAEIASSPLHHDNAANSCASISFTSRLIALDTAPMRATVYGVADTVQPPRSEVAGVHPAEVSLSAAASAALGLDATFLSSTVFAATQRSLTLSKFERRQCQREVDARPFSGGGGGGGDAGTTAAVDVVLSPLEVQYVIDRLYDARHLLRTQLRPCSTGRHAPAHGADVHGSFRRRTAPRVSPASSVAHRSSVSVEVRDDTRTGGELVSGLSADEEGRTYRLRTSITLAEEMLGSVATSLAAQHVGADGAAGPLHHSPHPFAGGGVSTAATAAEVAVPSAELEWRGQSSLCCWPTLEERPGSGGSVAAPPPPPRVASEAEGGFPDLWRSRYGSLLPRPFGGSFTVSPSSRIGSAGSVVRVVGVTAAESDRVSSASTTRASELVISSAASRLGSGGGGGASTRPTSAASPVNECWVPYPTLLRACVRVVGAERGETVRAVLERYGVRDEVGGRDGIVGAEESNDSSPATTPRGGGERALVNYETALLQRLRPAPAASSLAPADERARWTALRICDLQALLRPF